MNKELLIQTINWLEAGAPERRFDMGKMIEYDTDEPPTNWCGTTCCIAGYVWQTAHTPDDIPPGLYLYWDTIERQAATLLGLNFNVAHRLFYPSSSDNIAYPEDWDTITPAQAAQAIRNVMAHGEPRWEEILDFEESFE